ncbi:MAG: Gfo/Idh/MocA family oxidoreductase [Planctomycetota bacterium]|nr:Gfo/Idh/MocA family oxidoreductase [Planctomycetota bacterium]
METLRVCVIGMGPIGNLHADIYKSDSLAQLAGVCDLIPERAEKAGKRLGVPWFLDAQKMLAALKPDVCSIATGGYEYSSDHYEATLQALRAGCHVLCEKPICNEVDKAAEMVRVARELQRCLAVDFNHRFTPAARLAKKWQDEGRIGSLLFVNMALWIGRPGGFDSPYFHLKALNPHSVDIMRYYAGDVARVQCFAMKAPGRNFWSTASINMEFANGAVGHLTSSYDIERGHPMERCEVAGVKGRLVLEDMWREATLYPAGGDSVKSVYTNPVFGGCRGFDDTFRERIHCFLKELADGVPPEKIDGSGEAGLAAQKVIAAAIESLETGKVVEVATADERTRRGRPIRGKRETREMDFPYPPERDL